MNLEAVSTIVMFSKHFKVTILKIYLKVIARTKTFLNSLNKIVAKDGRNSRMAIPKSKGTSNHTRYIPFGIFKIAFEIAKVIIHIFDNFLNLFIRTFFFRFHIHFITHFKIILIGNVKPRHRIKVIAVTENLFVETILFHFFLFIKLLNSK